MSVLCEPSDNPSGNTPHIYARVHWRNAWRNALRTSALEGTHVAVCWEQPWCTDRTHFNIGLSPNGLVNFESKSCKVKSNFPRQILFPPASLNIIEKHPGRRLKFRPDPLELTIRDIFIYIYRGKKYSEENRKCASHAAFPRKRSSSRHLHEW